MRKRTQMGGVFGSLRSIFDAFGKKEKTGLPAPVPQAKESMFSVFAPREEKPKPSMFSAFGLPAVPSAQPKAFEVFKPKLPAVAPKPVEEERGLFDVLFPGAGEEERSPFEAFASKPIHEEPPSPVESKSFWPAPIPKREPWKVENWTRVYPDVAEYTMGEMPLWVLKDYGWVMPTTPEVVGQVKAYLDLNHIFETVLAFANSSLWREAVQEAPHQGGDAARYEIEFIEEEYLYKMMGLPAGLYRAYGYEPLSEESFWNEILIPFIVRFTKAMDILKYRGLRGWFELEFGNGGLWIVYLEAPHRPR